MVSETNVTGTRASDHAPEVDPLENMESWSVHKRIIELEVDQVRAGVNAIDMTLMEPTSMVSETSQ